MEIATAKVIVLISILSKINCGESNAQLVGICDHCLPESGLYHKNEEKNSKKRIERKKINKQSVPTLNQNQRQNHSKYSHPYIHIS